MDLYTLLYLKWITSKDLPYSTWNTAQYVVAWVGGVWGRVDMCMCMAESLRSSSETITTLLITCTPKQNKKLKEVLEPRFEHLTPAA